MKISSFLRRPFRYEFFNAAIFLILLNAGVFLIFSIGSGYMRRSMLELFALIPGYVMNGSVWQLVTYMFLHQNFSHLFFNMLGLFFFGVQIEHYMGSREFLLFYFVCGFAAGLFSFAAYILSGTYLVILIGASGAIYGVLLAFAAFYPRANIYVFGIIPVRAPILVLIYAAIAIFNQMGGMAGNVAHLTHLAGFVAAYIYLLLRYRINAIKVFFDR
ncbi:MAG: rhomboid family intramembrane serine protease [Spirochaetales bacterium]|jgi:membrane associated rhomboid family serine protease|nr:rhomboid family intramembrane serine protease [Spirochaetales bacterium]